MKRTIIQLDDEKHLWLLRKAAKETLDNGKKISMSEIVNRAIDEYRKKEAAK